MDSQLLSLLGCAIIATSLINSRTSPTPIGFRQQALLRINRVIESIVSAMERDAWLRSRADVLKASEHRWLTAARLVVLLLTLPLGGVLIATGAALADHLRRQGVLLAAVLATSCLLLVAEIVRSDRRAVLYFARRLQLAQ